MCKSLADVTLTVSVYHLEHVAAKNLPRTSLSGSLQLSPPGSSQLVTAADMTLSLGWFSALAAGVFSAHVLQKLLFPYFWRDLLFLMKVIRYGVRLELFKFTSSVCTVLDRFIQQAQRIPNKPFVIYDGSVHTYRDVEQRSNRLANVFFDRVGLRKGDCVALLMSNEPDFLCVWFGLAKVGCSVAFLNTNIKSKSLLHCFNCCGAKTLIVGSGKARTRCHHRGRSPLNHYGLIRTTYLTVNCQLL